MSDDEEMTLEGYFKAKIAVWTQQRTEREQHIPDGLTLQATISVAPSPIVAWAPREQLFAIAADRQIHLYSIDKKKWLPPLVGHSAPITDIAWSPDGTLLASSALDASIRIWDAQVWTTKLRLVGHTESIRHIQWNTQGDRLASTDHYGDVILWSMPNGTPQVSEPEEEKLYFLKPTLLKYNPTALAWFPNGAVLATLDADGTIYLWNTNDNSLHQQLIGHRDRVTALLWESKHGFIISCSRDRTIRIWDVENGREVNRLEGHTEPITSLALSADGKILFSQSCDDIVLRPDGEDHDNISASLRLWRTDTWEAIAAIPVYPYAGQPPLALHLTLPLLLSTRDDGSGLNIWEYDSEKLIRESSTTSTQYTNAKVVLMGDSGVGKSGLGLALTGQPFVPTESTHGRHVWVFADETVALDERRQEQRETLLWDLAGQPGYRLIHQLYLNEITVALIVFDGRSETDPFAGVLHWDRALRQARHIQGDAAPPLSKFLVAARTDRGGIGVGQERLAALAHELGCAGVFETSAKEGWHIAELAEAIKSAIAWDALPKVSSTDLFQQIKAFLLAEKAAGRVLTTSDDLYRAFLAQQDARSAATNLQAQFYTCIGLVESRDLIRRLSFGNLVLLQPELLDAYASALINAVRDEPDGLGSMREDDVIACHFALPADERLPDHEQERLLVIAMVQDLLRHDLALREAAEDGQHLVFPAQSTRMNPDLPRQQGKAVLFTFEGPITNIYATLAVRLSHSGLFRKQDLWKNAITFTARVGGTCGVALRVLDEGRGEFTLFFDERASEETRYHFEAYISAHLERTALADTLRRQRIFACPHCEEELPDTTVARRRERGLDWLNCPVCDQRISLLDREERLTGALTSRVATMDRAANRHREQDVGQTVAQGKRALQEFDVFLCHNGADKDAVKWVANLLLQRGISPWLDEWELQPGVPWQRLLEQHIAKIPAAAIFLGPNGIGPWQNEELDAFLNEFVQRRCPVIPIILPGCAQLPEVPIFLKNRTWVDFRKSDPDPTERLVWGITGKRGDGAYQENRPISPPSPA